MKFFLALLAAVLVVSPAFCDLQKDFDDIKALIPLDKVKALYEKYQNDPDIVRVITYLKSGDFTKVVNIVNHVAEVRDIVNYIQGKGVDIIGDINKLADFFGQPHWPTNVKRDVRTWQDFVSQLQALIPQDKITNMVMEKLATSDDFATLFDKISSVDYKKLEKDALSHPEIVDLITRLEKMGVDVQKIWEQVKAIFGWN